MTEPVVHEVYAVKFGHNDHGTRGRYHMGAAAEPAVEPMPIDYFVWAIRSPGLDIVLDAGFTAETNKGRPRTLIENPGAALARLGVDPASVPTVILSHFHNDHVGDLDAFPQATFMAQRAELNFWTDPVATRAEIGRHAEAADIARLVALNDAGRMRLLDGDTEIVDGVDVVRVGGHTPGMQVTVVRTAGGPVVLASDASHFFENVEHDLPFAVHADLVDMYRAFDRMRDLGEGGIVVAGHDPALFERFEQVPGLEGRAVRIA
jgi:glyoxylase-like metal-dependent hydrolase (beta-lactamase superfamily II)